LTWNQLRSFDNYSSDLTHANSEFLGWLRTTCYRQGNKQLAKRLLGCVSRPKDYSSNTCYNFWQCALFR